jgi:serpin B
VCPPPLLSSRDDFAYGCVRAQLARSISGALALLHAGARGGTRDEIEHALHLSPGAPAGDLLKLETRPATGFELSRGQRVFAEASLAVSPDYRRTIGSAFAPIDFRNHDNAAAEINRWTRTATRGHISDVLPPEAIDDRTRLVLVDALFAAARWATPFDPARTSPEGFTTLDGTVESLPMMHADSTQRFAREAGYDAVELPCADGEHALLVVAPALGHFEEFDASLDLDGFDRIVTRLSSGRVTLALPRFRAALRTTSIATELRALGITQALEGPANFDGVPRAPHAPLHVSDVWHAATIDVDERGAVAAAATALVMVLPSPVPFIRVDRPFLFWLRNIRTGAPIVMGRFMGGGG